MSVFLKKNLLGGRQRKEQCSGLTGQNSKSKALVKSDGLIVFGVHQKREGGGVPLQSSGGSIGEECRAQAAPLKSLVHGQSADPNGGHRRITGQTPGLVRRKINEGDTPCRNRVPGRNMVGGNFDSHEAIRYTTADVLGHLRLKVTIKRIFAAAK